MHKSVFGCKQLVAKVSHGQNPPISLATSALSMLAQAIKGKSTKWWNVFQSLSEIVSNFPVINILFIKCTKWKFALLNDAVICRAKDSTLEGVLKEYIVKSNVSQLPVH